MLVKDVIAVLGQAAPLQLAESYDNSGLQVGEPETEVKKVLVALELTESVLDEAIAEGANLVITHHPIWFKARKSLTGEDWVSRLILKAIRHQICLYAIHTNLDNIYRGVNLKIAEVLGLQETRILRPIPEKAFKIEVLSTHPVVAKQVEEKLTQVAITANLFLDGGNWVIPDARKSGILRFLEGKKPYLSYELSSVEAPLAIPRTGAGLIGILETPMSKLSFLQWVKQQFQCTCIRYADSSIIQKVLKVAVCGGSGSFLMNDALKNHADAFITADITYHSFFDTEGRMLLLDVGHFESEQYTSQVIAGMLRKKYPELPCQITRHSTNPVLYY